MEGSAWCPLMPQAACCALPIACPTRRPSKGRGALYSAMHCAVQAQLHNKKQKKCAPPGAACALPGPAPGVGG